MERTLFEELGGEPALLRIIDRFVDRMVEDVMIGFFFRNVDRATLKRREFEFAAQHLGAPIAYTGRPLEVAHRAHRIFDGQFRRRLVLLEETLREEGVPDRVREHWLAHTRSLMDRVVVGPCEEPAPGDAGEGGEG